MMAAGYPNDGAYADAMFPQPDDLEAEEGVAALVNGLLFDDVIDMAEGDFQLPEAQMQQLYLLPLQLQPQPSPPQPAVESPQAPFAQPAPRPAAASITIARQPQQRPEVPKLLVERVLRTSDAIQLPVHTMASWSELQKMKWTKTMLLRYLPCPTKEQQLSLLQLDSTLSQLGRLSLEQYINAVGQATLDSRTGGITTKLNSELNAWRKVCEIKLAEISCVKQEPKPGIHGRGTGDYLWEHVLRLLMEESPTVEWLNLSEGLFCFRDSSGAARSWGSTKNNVNMSFEKMSRSIRQYYRPDGTGVIQKAPEQPKLHYRFNMQHPEVAGFLAKNFRDVCERHAFLSGVVRGALVGQENLS